MNHSKISRVVILCLSVAILFSLPTLEARGQKRYTVSARAAIFSNSTKVKRYYGKNVHMRVLPASTTKVMTALVVLERLPLNHVVTFSKKASLAQPSKIYGRPGEKFRVKDLLYALLLRSANDASIALAEAVSGSEWKFVQLMNKKAKQLGANHTKFANSSGLPSRNTKQYTTAYDMYLIFRAALEHNFFKTVLKHKYRTIRSLDGRKIKLKSHNKILFFKKWRRKLFGKTGWTRSAKSCFVGYITKGRDICIIAVFGCSRRWDDIKYIVSRYGGISL